MRRSTAALAPLLFASFVSQLPYAAAQPLLPSLLGATGADVEANTGLLTAAYAAALFLFAPLWGSLSDRWPRRAVLLIGQAGLTLALIALSFVDSLPMLYLGLFLSGVFSAAIWPVALAMASERQDDSRTRARHFGWVYLAVTAGLLFGPAIGGGAGGRWDSAAAGAMFRVIAAASALALAFTVATLPAGRQALPRRDPPPALGKKVIAGLVALSFLIAWGIGAFEVGLTLRATNDFALSPDRIGWLFVECMVVMVAVQSLVFNARSDPRRSQRLFAPVTAALAAALLGLGFASSAAMLFVAVAIAAGALGVLSLAIGYWVSRVAGAIPGTQLGRQTAMASLGQAFGAGVSGLLFASWSAAAAFVLAAALAVLAAALALVVSSQLRLPGGQSAPEAVRLPLRKSPDRQTW